MPEVVARRVVVHGEVQGVFFRDSTRRQATANGVSGWVRNDPAGTVTAHLEGTQRGVTTVLDWIRAGGPPAARVADLEVSPVAVTGAATFEVRG